MPWTISVCEEEGCSARYDWLEDRFTGPSCGEPVKVPRKGYKVASRNEPKENVYLLVREKDWTKNGHGGAQDFRVFTLYVNGEKYERFCENSHPDYGMGVYFDKKIDAENEEGDK